MKAESTITFSARRTSGSVIAALLLWLCMASAVSAQLLTPIYHLRRGSVLYGSNWVAVVTGPNQTNGTERFQLDEIAAFIGLEAGGVPLNTLLTVSNYLQTNLSASISTKIANLSGIGTNLLLRPADIDDTALIIRGLAGQDSDVFRVEDNLGNRLFGINYDGQILGVSGESPRLAGSSVVGYVWTATNTFGAGEFRAVVASGTLTSVGLISDDLTTNNSPITTSGVIQANLTTNSITRLTEDQTPATNDPIDTVDVSVAARKKVVLGNLPVSGPVQTALNGKQAGSSTLTNLSGVTTNQLVFTNDLWLLIRGSNGVVVASGTGLSVISSGAASQQTFTISITDTELLEFSGISTNRFLTTNHTMFLLGISNNVRVVAGSSISVTPSGSGGIMSFTVDSTALVTNAASLSLSNATSKPILHGIVNRTVNFMGIEAGANVTITPNGTNYVIAASGGAASTNDVTAALGSLDLTNRIVRSVVALGNTTNGVIDWAGTNVVTYTPSNTFTITMTGSPVSGRHQSIEVIIINTNSTSGFFPTNDLNGGPVVMYSAPSTNRYFFVHDGTRFFITSAQQLISGTGYTNVLNVGATLINATLRGLSMPLLTADRVMGLNSSGDVTNSANVTLTELAALDGNTGATGSGNLVFSSTPTLNLPTLNNVKWAMQTPAITVSNILLSFSTNRYYLSGLTNAVLTNWVELAAGESADLALYIHNTTGVSMGIVWPAAGSSHGYHFSTNANNDVRAVTSLAAGGRLLVSVSIFGTNITPTATPW